MPNRTEARPAKAELTIATGRLPLLRLCSTPLKTPCWPQNQRTLVPLYGFGNAFMTDELLTCRLLSGCRFL
jgi:hypothetical protein